MSVWSAKGHRDQNETLPPNGVYRITVPMVPGGTLLDKSVDLVDKPIIIGEFHFGALDTGMFHYSLLPADDQAERAKLYREYHEATLRNPRYVGAHWFQ